MALVFTAVKAKIENECAEFLIGGEAESERDFECSVRIRYRAPFVSAKIPASASL